MEFNREHLRFLIETHRRNGWNATQTHEFIVKAWGEHAITYQSVRRLMSEFGSDRNLIRVSNPGQIYNPGKFYPGISGSWAFNFFEIWYLTKMR